MADELTPIHDLQILVDGKLVAVGNCGPVTAAVLSNSGVIRSKTLIDLTMNRITTNEHTINVFSQLIIPAGPLSPTFQEEQTTTQVELGREN